MIGFSEKKLKNLFLQQSYFDSIADYRELLKKDDADFWDYVVLTASNEKQAHSFDIQLKNRIRANTLPGKTEYIVVPDIEGKRIGSGGATLNVLRYISENYGITDFSSVKILIIHSGGDSKRIPQYSVCGKIFSPVPHVLFDGEKSTVFDELMVAFGRIPAKIKSGMFVASGDVLLLFNSLQLDFDSFDAAAVTFKESAERGQHHGVFLADEHGFVKSFLHKRTVGQLTSYGAVDASGNVNIDTGAVYFGSAIVNDLYSLVSEKSEFDKYVNELVRLNFYSDFLFPMATSAIMEDYIAEPAENIICDELTECRKILWKLLGKYKIRLNVLSPSMFVHIGTTHELLELLTDDIDTYCYLGWENNIGSNVSCVDYAVNNAFIGKDAVIGSGSYIEDSVISGNSEIGKNCIISNLELNDVRVPDGSVLHGVKLSDGRCCVRRYGISDDPKKSSLFGKEIGEVLWNYKCMPVCDTFDEAVKKALSFDFPELFDCEMSTLCDSFNHADTENIFEWSESVRGRIVSEKILNSIECKRSAEEVKKEFPNGLSYGAVKQIVSGIDPDDHCKLAKAYYLIYRINDDDTYYEKSLDAVRKIYTEAEHYERTVRIKDNDIVEVALPVRVNFAGGWSDTPPYCNENGGDVLNASVSLCGVNPIKTVVKRIDKPVIAFECMDNGAYREYTDISGLKHYDGVFDSFAIHRSVLAVLKIIGKNSDESFEDVLKRCGGGFCISTDVVNIPRGSGLGTSSILGASCLKAVSKFFGMDLSDDEIISGVLEMEQLMSTGGGWQDQVGGLIGGLKIASSAPGSEQKIKCTKLSISDSAKSELEDRFCLIYTGQRRLARNILRSMVEKYLGNDPEYLESLNRIRKIVYEMSDSLTTGDLGKFALLMNEHWECSKKMDSGSTNTCIDMIFLSCEDLISGKMICGAGGGGFLQVILKKGVTKQMLAKRLESVFADSGVCVWDSSFVW